MVGARLDNVYLDKELAGRIQQIQLLLAANTPADVKEKMWTQIESEMCLQRSKTIAQMCRTKQVGWHHIYLRKSSLFTLPPAGGEGQAGAGPRH